MAPEVRLGRGGIQVFPGVKRLSFFNFPHKTGLECSGKNQRHISWNALSLPWRVIRELPFRHRALAAVDDDRVRLILHGRRAEAEAKPDVGRAGHRDVDRFCVVGERQLQLAAAATAAQL